MTNYQKVTFDKNVLSYVQNSRQVDDSILNRRLIISYDFCGSLLHYAAMKCNTAVVQQLIDLGSEVDFVGQRGFTPFMRAVDANCSVALAKIFLKAKASIDIVDDDGRSVLQRALGCSGCDSPLVKLFASQVKTERTTPEALATRLIAAGCTMFEALMLRDVEVMQCMLDIGMGFYGSSYGIRSVLYRATQMNDVRLVEWLVEKGANVNPVDTGRIGVYTLSAIYVAAENLNEAILRILLERGADPNYKHFLPGPNSLQAIYEKESAELIFERHRAGKCVELLLNHGATFDVTPRRGRTIFDHALDWSGDETVKMLLSRLAMLKMLSNSVSEPIVFCNAKWNQSKQPELEKLYQLCLGVLKTKLFEDLSLPDLLNASETRLNSLVRRKMFVSRVETTSSKHKLSETHAFHYKTLMKRIEKAGRVVKLEDKAILVICKLFRCSYNKCYNFAREIVSYLKESELERLVEV